MSKIEITEELVQRFLEEKELHFSKGYLLQTKCTFDILLRNLSRDKTITPIIIAQALQSERTISRTTLKTKLTQIKNYLNWLLGKDHPLTLKFKDFKNGIKVPQDEMKIILEEDIKLVLRKIPVNYEFLIWLGCETSGRRESLTDLNIENIKFLALETEEARREFTPTYYQSLLQEYGPTEEITKITRYDKHGGEQAKKEVTTILNVKKTRKLKEYLEIRSEKEQTSKKEFVDQKGHFLFWNRKFKRMKEESVSSMFSRLQKRFNLDFTLHDTRRFFIQQLYEKGVRVPTIKKWSGHRSDAINRYFTPTKQTANSEILEKTD